MAIDAAALLAGTRLAPGNLVPGSELVEASTGRPVRPWAYRHRAPLVLVFVHDDCETCDAFVGALEERSGEDIRTAGGRVVAVGADTDGAARFVDPEDAPVVVILDRYAAAWSSYPSAGHEFPEPAEVAATLWHLATMCPECGVSTWD